MEQKLQKATFASGCFWCGEAVFEELEGVVSVESGYARPSLKASEGTAGLRFTEGKAPTYKEVSTGKTEYAEAIQITFDPSRISYQDLLEVFWATHDPTQLNRQGPDIGHQYRSMIFYHDEEQKRLAEESKKKIQDEILKRTLPVKGGQVVTEIVPFEKFYPAEEYHQNYYSRNPDAPYCQVIINTKLEKFRKKFKDKLRK